MVKNTKNMFLNMFLRLMISFLILAFLAVVLSPAGKVGAIVHWDGIKNKDKLIVIDLTHDIVPVGTGYVYEERCVKGAYDSDALFRDSNNNIENIKIDYAFGNPDAAGKDYGKVELADNFLCYTPGADAENMVIQVLLKLEVNPVNIVEAYRFDFQVGQGEADAESGGLKNLGYQLDNGQIFSVENYDAEIQEYQIILPPETPEGTRVTLTGTPLNAQASVSVEPDAVSVSSETNTQVLTVTTEDGKVRDYTVQFAIAPPEIQPSVAVNGIKYESGSTLLLDFQQPVEICIDTGSGTVQADRFAVCIEDVMAPGCLSAFRDVDGIFPEIEEKVSGKGTSQVTVRFYYGTGPQEMYTDVELTVKTRADYDLLQEMVEDIPLDLSLYTAETVKNLQQLTENIDYALDYSAQPSVSKLASDIKKAIAALEYRPADYSRIDQLVEKLDIFPDIYTSESIDAVRKIVECIQPELNICSQNMLDDCADKLQKAIDGLTVRSEEYTELHNLFLQIPEDLSIYSQVTVNKLEETMETVRQQASSVSAEELTVQMLQAINGLRLIGSVDFSQLEAYIAAIPDSFDWYTDQTVQAVHQWKDYAQALMQDEDVLQEQVDECLRQLEMAVEGLRLRKADYSMINKVLDQLPDDLSEYTTASAETVTRLIASIDWELDITRQQQLDLLAEQLLESINKLVLKPQTVSEGNTVPEENLVPQWNQDETPPVMTPEIIIPESIPLSSGADVGWKKENGQTVFYQNGKKVTGWQEMEGNRYYFTEDGYLVTGWLQLEDGWYYLGKDGIQQTGWIKLGNAWYYLMPKTGVMAADGRKMIENEIYCFYDWGGMMNTVWYQLGTQWYFFNGGGHMVKEQWVLWKGEWYYLTSDGKMAVDTITPDGYKVGKDGVWIP